MSDYLQNLIGVVHGAESRVRPVTRSFYEPALHEPTVLPTENADNRPAPAVAPSPQPARVDRPQNDRFESEREPARATAKPLVVPAARDPLKDSLLLPLRPVDRDESAAQPQPATAAPATNSPPPTVRPDGTAALPARAPRENSPSPSRETARRPSGPEKGFRPERVYRPDADVRDTPLALRASAPLPPVIHVTIGRVEVRAAPALERPAVRAKSPAPTLSLDQYLKARDGRTA